MVKAKYDNIGHAYDHTRKADPGITMILADLLNLRPGDQVLDIGCGTGNYSNAVWQKDIHMTGMDPSELMLIEAKRRNQKINWTRGEVETMPFEDGSFNKILATLTIHHWDSLNQGFCEAFRVLEPGGKMVLFTSTSEQMEGYWLNHYFPSMLERSIHQMPKKGEILEAVKATGFQISKELPWAIPDHLEDKFLYCGKNNPELYFDATIRNGISSFRVLAHQEEVEHGLIKLRRDIDLGEWGKIRSEYMNQKGDYLFISIEKN